VAVKVKVVDDPTGPRLASLAAVARALSGAQNLDQVLNLVTREAMFAFGADTAAVGRVERDRGVLRLLAWAGAEHLPTEAEPEPAVFRVVDLPLLRLLLDDARALSIDVNVADHESPESALLRRHGHGSALAVPVLSNGRVWGGLFVSRAADDPPYDQSDLDFALAFGGLVSAGIAQVGQLQRVARLAYEDALTGLANRRAIEEHLEEALAKRAITGSHVSLVMADVNRLKAANDRYGHAAGDGALVSVAAALSAASGRLPGALAGRLGGDEFCVVLDGHSLDEAASLAREFLALASDAPYGIGVACGVASTEGVEGPVTALTLIGWADEAQYDAKRSRATEPVISGGMGQRHDRRRWRGRLEAADVLTRSLAAVATRREQALELRAAAAVTSVADDVGAVGWVLSVVRNGVARPVAMGADREGILADVSMPAPPTADWFLAARATGIAVTDEDPQLPLASIRGVPCVVVASAGDLLAEILLDDAGPGPEHAPLLRAVLAVAVLG
jgi:diguanylate cyclase (GGDEF)-like protein